jgi:RNA 2',3'-cyclic 3'-phosphodiesterase
VAAPLPEMDAARLFEALAPLRERHPQVAWLPPNKLHLTLVFLGQTDSQTVPALGDGLASVAASHRPFAVVTGAAGGRVGGRRGGVAWLRLAQGGHQVAQLSLAVEEGIGSNTFDASHAPHPHLTVARKVSESALADLRAIGPGVPQSWAVDRIVLFRSHTGPGGSRYEELAWSALGEGP